MNSLKNLQLMLWKIFVSIILHCGRKLERLEIPFKRNVPKHVRANVVASFRNGSQPKNKIFGSQPKKRFCLLPYWETVRGFALRKFYPRSLQYLLLPRKFSMVTEEFSSWAIFSRESVLENEFSSLSWGLWASESIQLWLCPTRCNNIDLEVWQIVTKCNC